MFYKWGEVLSDEVDRFKLILFWVPMPSFCKKNPKLPLFFVMLPVYCDFGHIQSVIELLGKLVNNALNVH